ncbi:hypothetical protein V3C99_018183 [Haemonchus contortus]
MVSTDYDIRANSEPMWTETIIKKFPYIVIKDVLAKYQDDKNITIGNLITLLEKEISSKLFVETHWGSNREYTKETRSTNEPKTQNQKFTQTCVFCGRNNHHSAPCRTVTDIQKRRDIAKEKRLCWKSFNSNHSSNQCSKPSCPSCGQKHHQSICLASRPVGTNVRAPPANPRPARNESNQQNYGSRPQQSDTRPYNRYSNDARKTQQTNTQVTQVEQDYDRSAIDTSKNEQLILMTAEGNLWNNRSERFEKVLFFFDTGAQKTIIEENLANDFELPKLSTETCIMSGIGGHVERFSSTTVPLKVQTAYGKEVRFTVQTKPVITGGFSSVKLSQQDANFLEQHQICIANSKFQGEQQVPKILVGLDRYYDLVMEDEVPQSTPSGLRIAKTLFGPAIYGRGKLDSPAGSQPISFGLTAIHEGSESQMLEKLFELEGLGISSDDCASDDKVQQYFENYSNSISFDNGYVTAPFPLKCNVAQLEDNYSVAIKRLASLQNQLKMHSDQAFWYSKILNDYENQGIIERVFEKDQDAVGTYYMPHSAVGRPHKATPLRIVFDASSKKRGQFSVNDVIHKGESFVNKIHDILISSRFSKYLLLCDIEAAFTQIRLKDVHKDLCRFLWVKDTTKPIMRSNIIEYRFNRLPFGITASPSILNMALLAFLRSEGTELSAEISRDLYVDNILLQARTERQALQKYEESKTLFSKIGMNLREYISNSNNVNMAIPKNDRAPSGGMKLLGVHYDTENDRFTAKTNFEMKTTLTKRDIVSQINSVYDPLGVVGPLLIGLKSLMREIFIRHPSWDDRISTEFHKKWNTLCAAVNNAEITIPRVLSAENKPLKDSCLWVFADASKEAIATCSYIVFQDKTTSPLVSGKTKLSPKKTPQTIPRLELLGILIALRLGCSILRTNNYLIREIAIVSDSEIALCWLKSNRKLPLFVANQRDRITALKASLEDKKCNVQFMHVPTNLNPADAGTRGLNSKQICDHMWIQGPKWLSNSKTATLVRPIDQITAQKNESNTIHVELTNATTSSQDQNETFINVRRFSSLKILLRTVARIGKCLFKWVNRTNDKNVVQIKLCWANRFEVDPQISAHDIRTAESTIIQQIHKGIDCKELQKRFHHHKIIRDCDGIIRHASRLRNSVLPLDAVSPVFLPRDVPFTTLVLQDIHRSNAHCGKEHTLSLLRNRFWLPRPSSLIRKIIDNCTVCKRWQGLPFGAPEMPPLPNDRVRASKPFANTACDFIGPFITKSNENMYVCLYTCLTTRAVHLEVVENMTTGAFLNSFIRFVSRRGVPSLMRSDCGSNFKLGSKMISKMFDYSNIDNPLMSYCASVGIRWIFNLPASPWMGGVWERLVGSVKKCLNKSVGRRKLSYTEISTAMAKIEAIINTRPLTKINLTDISEIPLRPVDFLQGNMKFSLP